jgi:hypothetical protein
VEDAEDVPALAVDDGAALLALLSLQPARSRVKRVTLAAIAAEVLCTERDGSRNWRTSPPVRLTGGYDDRVVAVRSGRCDKEHLSPVRGLFRAEQWRQVVEKQR